MYVHKMFICMFSYIINLSWYIWNKSYGFLIVKKFKNKHWRIHHLYKFKVKLNPPIIFLKEKRQEQILL